MPEDGVPEDGVPENYGEGRPTSATVVGDWSVAGDFFGAILAGLLIGLAADYILNTQPWLVVIGIIAGFAVGFWRMVAFSDLILQQVTNPRLARIAKMEADLKTDDDDS